MAMIIIFAFALRDSVEGTRMEGVLEVSKIFLRILEPEIEHKYDANVNRQQAMLWSIKSTWVQVVGVYYVTEHVTF